MNNTQTERVEVETVSSDMLDSKVHIKKAKQNKIKKIVISLFLIAVFFILTTMYSQYQVYVLKKSETNKELANSKVPVTPSEIVESVSHHILLPKATPQIAAVQDAKKLSTSQTFFKDAINGDIVLVYEKTIIIYRPSKDIVVAVGDIGGTSK